MFTRRDLVVAIVAITTTAAVFTVAQSVTKPPIASCVLNWDTLKVTPTKTGEVRAVFSGATATLTRLDLHITTLNPGESPHPPHRHPQEEMMILKEGTLEAVQNGQTNRVEAGGIVFCASNDMHGLRNVGTNRATYYVLQWSPHDLPAALGN
jgi:quercetin dioxygenase-like cupin family protein